MTISNKTGNTENAETEQGVGLQLYSVPCSQCTLDRIYFLSRTRKCRNRFWFLFRCKFKDQNAQIPGGICLMCYALQISLLLLLLRRRNAPNYKVCMYTRMCVGVCVCVFHTNVEQVTVAYVKNPVDSVTFPSDISLREILLQLSDTSGSLLGVNITSQNGTTKVA